MLRTVENEALKVTINDLGAEMVSVISKKDGFEYLWQGDPKFWVGHAYNLFPICGRLTDSQYTYKGKTYEMNLHGFARKTVYRVKEEGAGFISFILTPDAGIKEQYPFDFELVLTYTLEGSSIITTFNVTNTGKTEELIFAVGGHPGFNVPLEDGLAFSDYYVEFSQPCDAKRLAMSATCYMTDETPAFPLEDGKRIHLHHDMFDDDAIFLCDIAKEVTLRSAKNERSVTLNYPDMNYLGLWHAPKKEAPYVCIEPWYSVPSYDGVIDKLETKRDMLHLEPGKSYKNSFSITIK